MRTSSIKTTFQIIGAGLILFSIFFLLYAIDDTAAVIPLLIGLSLLFAGGAAHLAWHRGLSPLIPIVTSMIGIPVLIIIVRIEMAMAAVSYILMTFAPILVVFTAQAKRSRRSRRNRTQ
jgi:hypothetical protein